MEASSSSSSVASAAAAIEENEEVSLYTAHCNKVLIDVVD